MVNTKKQQGNLKIKQHKPHYNGVKFRCYVRVGSSCTTSDTHRVTIAQDHHIMCKINTNNIYNIVKMTRTSLRR
jgi:hypothetical protein